jgi:hypothetical protein
LLSHRVSALLLASAFALAGPAAGAQDKKSDEPCVPGKPCAAAQPAAPAKKVTRHAKAARAKQQSFEGPMALWPGFRMLPGGGSQVVVLLNQTVQPQLIKTQSTLSFVLPGFHVPVTNNRRPLLTHFFNTPVADARLVQDKQDVRLVIDLRAVVEPKITVAAAPGGKSFELQVDFPPGDYRPETHDLQGPRADRGHGPEPGAPPPRQKRGKQPKTPPGPPVP